MAEFSVASIHVYYVHTNGFLASQDGHETLDDGESDIVFDLGPPSDSFTFSVDILGTVFDITGSFYGYLPDFDGEQVPVIFVPNSEIPGIYGTLAPSGLYIVASARDQADVTAPGSVDFSTDLIVDEFEAICFLPGTAIATPGGAVAVENLAIGDDILTADGRTIAVAWIGRQTISTRFGPTERRRPVRIAAGALGPDLPLRDLRLTADHALLLDGLLVNAGALVNGTSVTFEPLADFGDSLTLYHVETDLHDVILAEGTPAETFIDYVGRQAFDNHTEYVALYGEDRKLPEMAQPRVTSARLLPAALRARLGLDHAA